MQSPLKGKFLIASPHLRDPNFFHSVILIVSHDENGAMGLIINRPLEMSVGEAWKQVSEIPYDNEEVLHQGGPCEGMLMVLHRQEEQGQLEVFPGVWLSTDAESVRTLVDRDQRPLKFFVGYAGWSPGQLEAEIGESAWSIIGGDEQAVFDTPEDLWGKLVQEASHGGPKPNVDPRLLPPDPHVN